MTGTPGATNSTQLTNLSSLDGADVTLALNNSITPYRATFYVDPAGALTFKNGSQAFPFATIAAAFAAGVALGLSGALIILPPESTVVENITFPNGGDWEVAGGGTGRTSLTGNITCTTAAQTACRLTNLVVSGTCTGVASSGSGNFLFLTNGSIAGAASLTASGAGFWFVICSGLVSTFFSFSGGFLSSVTVTGALLADTWSFIGAINVSSNCSLNGCRLASSSLTVGNLGIEFTACILNILTITGTGSSPVLMDGYTTRWAMQQGLTLVSAVLKTAVANASAQLSIVDNVGSSSFTGGAGLTPVGMYTATAVEELMAAGIAGTAVVNIHYVDMNGAAQIEAITVPGLLITAALGVKARGTLPFVHNGSTQVTYSVTGIITPGALSINLNVSIRRAN